MSERGFTLIEGLFSFLLVLLILGALSQTLANAAKIRSNRVNMDRAVDELHGLNTIRDDLSGSLELLEPSSSGASQEIRLTRVNPALTFGERIDVASGPDLPYEQSEQVEIVYQIENGQLRRNVSTPSEASIRSVPLLNATHLEAEREGHLVSVTLRFRYSRVEKLRVLKMSLR